MEIIFMEASKLSKNKKILIIAAHPDDEILGCGGVISKLKKNNKIQVVFLTDGVSSRTKNNNKINIRKTESIKLFKYLKIQNPIFFDFSDNELDKSTLLNIVKKVELIIQKFKPNIIFTHYEHCLNIDHKIAYQATITAARPLKKNNFIEQIISYEVPSSTEWRLSNKYTFIPNVYFDISKEIKNKKSTKW